MALGNNGMEYLEELPEKLVEYWAMLELDILRDMARKLRAAELYIPATEYQHRKLSLLGMMYNDILELLAGALGSTFDAIEEIITNEGINTLREEAGKYRTAAELGLLEAVPERKLGSVTGAVGAEELTEAQVRANIANLLGNDDAEAQAIKQIIDAGIAKTEGTFSNLTSTTANTATQQFERALDRAYMQVSTGAFSLEKAVEDAVEELAAQGIGSITYPSGRVDTVEVAVRRAVVTGVNQTNLKLREQFADEMECDLVEVSAHEGARPEHAEWQGKIYSRKGNDPKYPDFAASTGYGTGAGLGGWNCRHTFSAYFEGMPRAWSDEELEQLKNETVEYKGEQIPRYVAQQRMREMERSVRKYRREAAVADDERAAGFLEKEREARARYVDFCKETGLKEQPERFRSANVFNNTNKSAENRDVLLKKIRNQESDYEQYEKYKAVLGENAPKSFAKFQDLKYNEPEKWRMVKLDKIRQSTLITHPNLALPGSEKIIPEQKFTGYLFNPNNHVGWSKGKAFTSHLGYCANNYKELQSEILSGANKYPASFKAHTEFGDRYEQKMILYGTTGNPANVVVGWIHKTDGTVSMTTAYIKEV